MEVVREGRSVKKVASFLNPHLRSLNFAGRGDAGLCLVHLRVGPVEVEVALVVWVAHGEVFHRLAVGGLFGVEFFVPVLEEGRSLGT